jgi:chromosome segregation ATPase
MGANGESQLITELEATLEQQQTAVDEGNAAIRETIRELHEALQALDQRQNSLTQTAADFAGRAVTGLEAVRAAVSDSNRSVEEHETALERIAELERALLARESLAERLEASEGQREQLQRELDQQAQLLVEAEKAHKKLRKIEQVYKDASDALQAGQAARRRVAELETTVEEYKQAAHAERDRAAGIQEALDAARQCGAKLQAELDALKAQDFQQTAEDLDAARRNGVTLAAELVEARRAVARLEKDSHELDDEVASRTVESETWQRQAEEYEEKCVTLASDLEALRRLTEEAHEAGRGQREALERAEAELNALRLQAKRAEELQARVERLEAESAEVCERAKHAECELSDERAKGKKSQLAAQLAEALSDREAAREELRKWRQSANSGRDGAAAAPSTPAIEQRASDSEEKSLGPLLRKSSDESRRLLGEIFVNAGIISAPQLEEALAAQKKERPWKHLGSILVGLGRAEETQVAQAVAHQRRLEYLSLGQDSINRDAARLISARLAEKHLCIPVREEDGELVVAMENPLDLIAIEDVERASERRVRPAVATPTAILAAIATIYTPERQRA